MKKKILLYTLAFLVLMLGFYTALFYDNDHWKTKVQVVGYVQPFHFTNQSNQPITKADMIGNVCVVEFFFTSCRGICPLLNTNMAKLYSEFKDEAHFKIFSFTSQPEVDSPARLKHYADSLGVNTAIWQFVTGNKDSLYLAARASFLLDDPKNNVANINDQFIHTQFFALVDKAGKVRGGAYDGLKETELARLRRDIVKLLQETP